ncbi:uncharacterized protein K489DRAFT_93303 [Dissoconium aciculare CBS 342.82]|uniref:Uncharacterized protein n=1 Tax=Dissoconium aciculare CBS 342.82 TaxID=1314786 RepID=A0A6J3LRE1_9PEZI|nr:uncharacterized protein K489DRAFT_93303 [Dissoconium aciculare CBS 342.82]KAF1818406.1 hypothetical protein K489DRAFT_93303 [Dissoconium aciculare CBS 342.82]
MHCPKQVSHSTKDHGLFDTSLNHHRCSKATCDFSSVFAVRTQPCEATRVANVEFSGTNAVRLVECLKSDCRMTKSAYTIFLLGLVVSSFLGVFARRHRLAYYTDFSAYTTPSD